MTALARTFSDRMPTFARTARDGTPTLAGAVCDGVTTLAGALGHHVPGALSASRDGVARIGFGRPTRHARRTPGQHDQHQKHGKGSHDATP